jgi:hypothetical protein
MADTVLLHDTDNTDDYLADSRTGPMYDGHACADADACSVNACAMADAQAEAEGAYRAALVVAVTAAASRRGLTVLWADTDPDRISHEDPDDPATWPYDPNGRDARNADVARSLWDEAHGNVFLV